MTLLNSPAWYSEETSHDDRGPIYDYLPGIESGNMAMMLADAQRVGGFDLSFCYGIEDVDFAWRCQQAGMRVVNSEAVIHYRLRETPLEVFGQFRNYGRGNIMLRLHHQEHLKQGISFKWSLYSATRNFLKLLLTSRRSSPAQKRDLALGIGMELGKLEAQLRYKHFGKLPERELHVFDPQEREA